jgi:short subunit dehydrogenase-like uncharacterized protein
MKKRLPIIILVCGFALIGWNLFKPKAASVTLPVGTGSVEATASSAEATEITSEVNEVVQSQLDGSTYSDVAQATEQLKTSEKKPAQIRLEEVNYITKKGANPLIVFTDGSELSVTPSVMAQLPGSVRVRLERSYGN